MFGVLNNNIQLSNDGLSNVNIPSSRLMINGSNTLSALAQLHINQIDNSLQSGILLVGTDAKQYSVSYNGSSLAFTEGTSTRMVIQNGGNIGVGVANPQANVHIANDLRVDGDFTVNGSVTTINSTSTMTHMLEIENAGSGPAVLVKQTGAMPSLQVYDDSVLALNVASGGFVGINNAAPMDWLDIIGSLSATGCLKSAWAYSRSPPASGTTQIGTMSGGYLGWNRSGNSGYTIFANQRGSLSGGWEYVSYTSSGSYNGVSFDINDSGSFRSFGAFGSVTGNLYIGQNTYLYGTVTNYTNSISIGASNSPGGPHSYVYFTGDSYPAYQQSVWAHDNLSQNFDSYFDGNNWRYSSSTTGFQISKMNSNLYIRPSSAAVASAGGLLSWSAAGIDMASSGMVGINTSPQHMLDVGGDVNVQANLYVSGVSSMSGNLVSNSTISSSAIQISQFASVSGNIACGTSLTIGSVTTSQLLNILGTYSSFAGAVSIGTYLQVGGSSTILGNLTVRSSGSMASLAVGSNISIGSSLAVGADCFVRGQSSLSGNLAVGSSATIANNLTVGNSIAIGSSLAVTADMVIYGQATLSGNISILGNATTSGNLFVGSQSSISGNLSVGSSSTIAGNLRVGTSLAVGSIISATALNISGPYASVSGNAWVGTNLYVMNNATISGTVNSFGGLNVGTIQVINQYGSLLTGVSGGGAVSASTISTQALLLQCYGSVQGGLAVGTDIAIGRNASVSQTLTAANINCTGQYSSISGLLMNNVLGSLLLRGYDESGSYKNTTLYANSSLPAPFLTRSIAASQISSINLSSASVGTLASQYSMRISGYVYPPATGTYTFQMTYKDGLTVWIGPDKLVDSWVELTAASVTTAMLTMYQGMWTPIIIEHANAAATESLNIQWCLNGSGTFSTMSHASDGSNFQLAYDMYDVPPAVLGTTYISGKTFFGDEAIMSAGMSLPNASFFSGNTSELNNDAGFLQSTPATLSGQAMYVAKFASITGTISSYAGSFSSSLYSGGSLTGGSAVLSGIVDVFAKQSNGQLRISPSTGTDQASIGLFRNASRANAAIGDMWVLGNSGSTSGNFFVTAVGNATGLTVTPSGLFGLNNATPSCALDVTGSTRATGSLTIGGSFSMTAGAGTGSAYFSNNISSAGGLTVGLAGSVAGVGIDILPAFDNISKLGTSTSRFATVSTYAIDAAGASRLAGGVTLGGTNVRNYLSTLTSLTVSPTSADIPNINPDAFNTLMIYEDGAGTSLNLGTLTGTAVYGTTSYCTTQNCIQLTGTLTNQSGGIVWAINPGNSWGLEAETYVGGGTGAESITFFVYSSSTTGISSGYTLVFDEYSNINNNNTTKQFSLTYAGTTLSSVPGSALGGTFQIPLAQWSRLKILFNRNNIRVYLDVNLVLSFKDVSRSISGDNTYYCGFVGATGATLTNFHAVRNVKLSKHVGGIWQFSSLSSSDIIFSGGRVGIGTVTPSYSLDVNGSARVTGSLSVASISGVVGSLNSLFASTNLFNSMSGTFSSVSGISSVGTLLAAVGTLGSITFGSFLGIGTVPAYNLDVLGSARITPTSNNSCALYFANPTLASGSQNYLMLGSSTNLGGAAYLNYFSCGLGTSSSSWGFFGMTDGVHMSSTAAGSISVGINTSSPAYTLDVSGSARVTGSLTAGTAHFSTTVLGSGTLLTSNGAAPNGLNLVSTVSGTMTAPHVAVFPNSTYPCFQQLNWANDNVSQCFDSYYDGSVWRSSGTSSPYQIYKNSSSLQFNYAAVGTASQSISWSPALFINGSGNVGVNTSSPSYPLQVTGNSYFSGTITFPTTGGGLSWGSGPFSAIFDNGDLHIATDDTMRFNIGLSSSSVGTQQMYLNSGGLYVTGNIQSTYWIPTVVNNYYSAAGSLTSFATPTSITKCYGRILLFGNGGQGGASAFNIRIACSSNGGTSYDTSDYNTFITQFAGGSNTAIAQSGYPTVATNLTGYLNTHSIQIYVARSLYDIGLGQTYCNVLDVTVNGQLSNGVPYRNTGTIIYNPGGDTEISNVRISLEGQSNASGGYGGGYICLGVDQINLGC